MRLHRHARQVVVGVKEDQTRHRLHQGREVVREQAARTEASSFWQSGPEDSLRESPQWHLEIVKKKAAPSLAEDLEEREAFVAKMTKWNADVLKALRDPAWFYIQRLSHKARGPWRHVHLWLEKFCSG